MTITDRLDEIEARADAATEGPWEEAWRPIPGYDGYEVSDFGNIRSYYLKGNHKQKRSPHPRTLAKRSRANGAYPSVSLPHPETGNYHSKAIHRLVMLAFVGPCPEGMEVAHLNGDPADNRLSNLRYVTHQENESHKLGHGTTGHGERNSVAKLQGWQVAEVKFLAGKSVPQGKIAALFDIGHKQVNDILRERSWSQEPARADVPALVATLRAVLDRHPMSPNQRWVGFPRADRQEHYCMADQQAWPCDTYRAMEAALGERRTGPDHNSLETEGEWLT